MLDLLFGHWNRHTRVDSDQSSVGWVGGLSRRTLAGPSINDEVALTYAAVWCATRIICETMSSLPASTYRRLPNGDRETAPEHYTWNLLKTSPNPDMAALPFIEGRTMHQVNRGNGFAEIEKNRDGEVVHLWPIHASRMRPPGKNEDVGGATYMARNDNGTETRLFDDEVLHVPGVFPEDGRWGKGVIQYARESVGFGLATERHGSAYFGSGAQPKGILVLPGLKDKEVRANFRKEWKELHGAGSSEIAILPPEGKYQAISISNEDSQFIECCVPETLVALADGTLRRCDQLTINDVVLGWDETAGRLVPSQLESIANNGVHPLIRITTHRGRELITTRNHAYLASKRQRCSKCSRRHGPLKHGLESKWLRADALSVGDYVRAGLRFENAEPLHIDVAEAWYVGALVGDGYCRGTKAIGFSNVSAGIIGKMQSFCDARGFKMRQKVSYPTDWYFVGRAVAVEGDDNRSIAREILKPYGVLGKRAHEKVVPARIMKASTDARAAFIAGLWDTDGTISKPEAKQPRIVLASVSKELLEGTRHLLASLGIQSAIYRQGSPGERIVRGQMCKVRQGYALAVCGKSEAKRFAAFVGPHMAEEGKRSRIEHLASADLGNQEDGGFFEYDRIVKIEELPPGLTIALTVEGTHSHVTNGLVTHNTRKFNINEWARWYRVPAHMLGDLERATHSNIEHQGIEFVVYSMLPWVRRWEQECNRKLFLPEERGQFYIEFNLAGLLRGDLPSRMAAYQVALMNGIMTINEVRRLENLPGIGPAGDVHYVPLNMSTAERMLLPPEPKQALPRFEERNGQQQDQQASQFKDVARSVLRDALGRMFTQEAHAVRQASTRADFETWLSDFHAKHRGSCMAALSPASQALGAAGLRVSAIALADQAVADSKQQLLSAYNSQTPESFGAMLDGWADKRAGEQLGKAFEGN